MEATGAEIAAPGPVRTRTRRSSYGMLEYVPPPFAIGGEALDFPSPPAPYGHARTAWR